jgi:diaminopimelate decarboxylase
VGTPCYVYDAGLIRAAYATLDGAFGAHRHAIHYALKANSSLAIVRLLHALGSQADANSLGEVDVALRCGFRPDQIVFTGVGKSAAEIDRAVSLGLLAINVESPGELDRIDQRAAAQGVTARVALRVNPDIDARSHPHISTGLRSNKFGVPIDEAPALFREMAARRGLQPVGAHVHIGSQITTLVPLRQAAAAVVALARALGDEGIALQHLDMGGGLGISYDGGPVADPSDYVRALVAATEGSGLLVAIEPGRVLVGPAGVLLTTVVDVKEFPGAKRFVVVDAGMTELMRPALYNAYHRIEPLVRRPGDEAIVDIVGPICESTDAYARDRAFPPVEVGDLVVVRDVGAYGAVMGHTYLRRPLPPEVLIDGEEWRIIRRRQTLDELLALETE